MLIADQKFFLDFKAKTEHHWAMHPISGFQGSHGSFWNPGLSDDEIMKYEKFLGAGFPTDFVNMLSIMNGTTTPNTDYSRTQSLRFRDVYAYPRDLEVVKAYIEILKPDLSEIVAVLAEQGYNLEKTAKLLPIFSHRYLVCDENRESSVVLSIVGTDAIVYGEALIEYLQAEFLPQSERS